LLFTSGLLRFYGFPCQCKLIPTINRGVEAGKSSCTVLDFYEHRILQDTPKRKASLSLAVELRKADATDQIEFTKFCVISMQTSGRGFRG